MSNFEKMHDCACLWEPEAGRVLAMCGAHYAAAYKVSDSEKRGLQIPSDLTDAEAEIVNEYLRRLVAARPKIVQKSS